MLIHWRDHLSAEWLKAKDIGFLIIAFFGPLSEIGPILVPWATP